MLSNSDSLEQTIYRRLAAQIQLGFFGADTPFPSAQMIARQFCVSYCPAQRALKALAQNGLIKIGRGKETVVLKKPYENYLESDSFKARLAALDDLSQSLQLLSPAISFHGAAYLNSKVLPSAEIAANNSAQAWRSLYRLFEQTLTALGNRTALSLYYDISAFAESSFADNLRALCGESEEKRLLHRLERNFVDTIHDFQAGRFSIARKRMNQLGEMFFEQQRVQLRALANASTASEQLAFTWTPHKGRARYCDLIAIDLIRKIRRGIYPIGVQLPGKSTLADIYHVSAITIRRTIELLNKSGVTATVNGVGAYVLNAGDTAIAGGRQTLLLDENLRTFLEAFQLLLITSEPVVQHSFPHFSSASLHAIVQGVCTEEVNAAMIATTSACIQAVVHHCPLAAIREIYGKLTLLLLQGNALIFDGFERSSAKEWPAIAKAFVEAVETKNHVQFATAFRRLISDNFSVLKSHLQKIGVPDIDSIVTPLFGD